MNQDREVIQEWKIGDKFTTPETGEQVFTVIDFGHYDVVAKDKRSRSGETSFAKSYITRVPTPAPEPQKEEGDFRAFYDWLMSGQRLFFIDEVRKWIRDYDAQDISLSKFVELFNEKVFHKYHQSEPHKPETKEPDRELMKGAIEYLFGDDNPFVYHDGRWLQACGNSTSWSTDQLIDLYLKLNTKQ